MFSHVKAHIIQDKLEISTCPWTSINIVNTNFHILINNYELACCMENSVNHDQLASEAR